MSQPVEEYTYFCHSCENVKRNTSVELSMNGELRCLDCDKIGFIENIIPIDETPTVVPSTHDFSRGQNNNNNNSRRGRRHNNRSGNSYGTNGSMRNPLPVFVSPVGPFPPVAPITPMTPMGPMVPANPPNMRSNSFGFGDGDNTLENERSGDLYRNHNYQRVNSFPNEFDGNMNGFSNVIRGNVPFGMYGHFTRPFGRQITISSASSVNDGAFGRARNGFVSNVHGPTGNATGTGGVGPGQNNFRRGPSFRRPVHSNSFSNDRSDGLPRMNFLGHNRNRHRNTNMNMNINMDPNGMNNYHYPTNEPTTNDQTPVYGPSSRRARRYRVGSSEALGGNSGFIGETPGMTGGVGLGTRAPLGLGLGIGLGFGGMMPPGATANIEFGRNGSDFFSDFEFTGGDFFFNDDRRLVDVISGIFTNVNMDYTLDHIITAMMDNDLSRNGPPPTADSIIENLRVERLTAEKARELGTCSICKEEFVENDEVNRITEDARCNHYFHNTCIVPWLRQRNSCPVCRFELPTDDWEYNNRREVLRERLNEEMNRNNNNTNNNNNNNSTTTNNNNNGSNEPGINTTTTPMNTTTRRASPITLTIPANPNTTTTATVTLPLRVPGGGSIIETEIGPANRTGILISTIPGVTLATGSNQTTTPNTDARNNNNNNNNNNNDNNNNNNNDSNNGNNSNSNTNNNNNTPNNNNNNNSMNRHRYGNISHHRRGHRRENLNRDGALTGSSAPRNPPIAHHHYPFTRIFPLFGNLPGMFTNFGMVPTNFIPVNGNYMTPSHNNTTNINNYPSVDANTVASGNTTVTPVTSTTPISAADSIMPTTSAADSIMPTTSAADSTIPTTSAVTPAVPTTSTTTSATPSATLSADPSTPTTAHPLIMPVSLLTTPMTMNPPYMNNTTTSATTVENSNGTTTGPTYHPPNRLIDRPYRLTGIYITPRMRYNEHRDGDSSDATTNINLGVDANVRARAGVYGNGNMNAGYELIYERGNGMNPLGISSTVTNNANATNPYIPSINPLLNTPPNTPLMGSVTTTTTPVLNGPLSSSVPVTTPINPTTTDATPFVAPVGRYFVTLFSDRANLMNGYLNQTNANGVNNAREGNRATNVMNEYENDDVNDNRNGHMNEDRSVNRDDSCSRTNREANSSNDQGNRSGDGSNDPYNMFTLLYNLQNEGPEGNNRSSYIPMDNSREQRDYWRRIRRESTNNDNVEEITEISRPITIEEYNTEGMNQRNREERMRNRMIMNGILDEESKEETIQNDNEESSRKKESDDFTDVLLPNEASDEQIKVQSNTNNEDKEVNESGLQKENEEILLNDTTTTGMIGLNGTNEIVENENTSRRGSGIMKKNEKRLYEQVSLAQEKKNKTNSGEKKKGCCMHTDESNTNYVVGPCGNVECDSLRQGTRKKSKNSEELDDSRLFSNGSIVQETKEKERNADKTLATEEKQNVLEIPNHSSAYEECNSAEDVNRKEGLHEEKEIKQSNSKVTSLQKNFLKDYIFGIEETDKEEIKQNIDQCEKEPINSENTDGIN